MSNSAIKLNFTSINATSTTGGTSLFTNISPANTINFKSLSGGTNISLSETDGIIVISGAAGGSSSGSTTSYSFQNGLTETNDIVRLGGNITGNTTISFGNSGLLFSDSVNYSGLGTFPGGGTSGIVTGFLFGDRINNQTFDYGDFNFNIKDKFIFQDLRGQTDFSGGLESSTYPGIKTGIQYIGFEESNEDGDNANYSGLTGISLVPKRWIDDNKQDRLISEQNIKTIQNQSILGSGDLQIVASLEVFYVDSNNNTDGDGSIINPFRTLDLAYSAVIGTGTASIPQNQNITISVAGGTYDTSLNLVINRTTWFFGNGAIVNYNGTDSLFSTPAMGQSSAFCNVFGNGSFQTNTGSIINAEGTLTTTSSTSHRIFTFECQDLFSGYNNTNDANDKILIRTSGSNGQRFALLAKINGRITSRTQSVFNADNGVRFELLGRRAFINIGSLATGAVDDNVRVFQINNTLEGIISDFSIFSYNADSYIQIGSSGTTTPIGTMIFDAISMRTTTLPFLPVRFLNIGDITVNNTIPTEARLVFSNISYIQNNFSDTNLSIKYIGSSGTFENLEFYNSRLPFGVDQNILLNKTILTTASSPSNGIYENLQIENTFGGRFNISNILGGDGDMMVINERGDISRSPQTVQITDGVNSQKAFLRVENNQLIFEDTAGNTTIIA